MLLLYPAMAEGVGFEPTRLLHRTCLANRLLTDSHTFHMSGVSLSPNGDTRPRLSTLSRGSPAIQVLRLRLDVGLVLSWPALLLLG